MSTTFEQGEAAHARLSRLLCAMIAGVLWLIYFYFGRHANYAGDDFNVMTPALLGDFARSLQGNIRPFEYFAARISAITHSPFWLLVSAIAYVATAVTTLDLFDAVCPDRRPPVWKLLLAASTPLVALTYFQIDTVSQALANLFGVIFVLHCLRILTGPSPEQRTAACWRVATLGILCVLSKETAYGIVFLGSVLVLFKFRLRAIIPVLVTLAVLFAAALANVHHHDLSPGAFYGFKINPLYWPFTIVFSVAVALAPVPTATLLTRSWTATPAMIGLVVLGSAVALIGVILYAIPTARAVKAGISGRWRSWFVGEWSRGELVVAFALAALFPSMLFKASELYATQMLPFLKASILLAIASAGRRRLEAIYWTTICCFWIAVSVCNTAFYSVATGYDATGGEAGRPTLINWFYANVTAAVTRRAKSYSSYSYQVTLNRGRVRDCLYDLDEQHACLTEQIGSGFPTWRDDPKQSPADEAPEPGVWQLQTAEFRVAGLTPTYSCDMLEAKLRSILRHLGARADAQVTTFGCQQGWEAPSESVFATLRFASLQPRRSAADPSDGATAITGAWRPVELAPYEPLGLQPADCELLQRFRERILPLLATQPADAWVPCGAHEQSGGRYALPLRVFSPEPSKAG